MRKFALLLVTLSLLPFTVAAAQPGGVQAAAACKAGDGQTVVPRKGKTVTLAAPAAPTGPGFVTYAAGEPPILLVDGVDYVSQQLVIDTGGKARKVTIDVTWADPVNEYDAQATVGSGAPVVSEETGFERFIFNKVKNCTVITVDVYVWAALPGDTISLKVTVK